MDAPKLGRLPRTDVVVRLERVDTVARIEVVCDQWRLYRKNVRKIPCRDRKP